MPHPHAWMAQVLNDMIMFCERNQRQDVAEDLKQVIHRLAIANEVINHGSPFTYEPSNIVPFRKRQQSLMEKFVKALV